jgi:hypothetical protein
MLCYDVESTFLRKGFTRGDTKLLEVAFYNEDVSFQRMVNPCTKYATGEEIVEDLYIAGSDPDKSIRFWTKLLIEKGSLSSANKRKNKWEQATAISELLKRSDIALKHKEPLKVLYVLEQGKTEDDALEFVKDTTLVPKPSGRLFYRPCTILKFAIDRYKQYTWIAHNGKSFDEKILKGHEGIDAEAWKSIKFLDSLPILRTLCPGHDSYSQPLLYKAVLGKSYFAHHALEDSKALHQLLTHVLAGRDIHSVQTSKPKVKLKVNTDLLQIKGVGPVTAQHLIDKKITNRRELSAYVRSNSFLDWDKAFKFRGSRKLGEKLFNIK